LTQAEITLLRIAARLTIQGLGTVEGNADLAEAHFRRFNAADVLASMGIQTFPSLGSCSLQQFQYEGFIDSVFSNQDPVPRQEIDAGPALSVMGPLGMKQAPQSPQSVGAYEAMLGGISFDGPPLPDFLDPGTYTIGNGAGGAGVGPFSTEVVLPGNLLWTNRDTLSNPIPRNQPLPITWGSADSATEFVYILGSSADPASGSGASFLCTVNAGLGSFNVPAYILSALPASGQAPEGRVGFLGVGNAPLRAGSSATIADVQIAYRYYRYGHLINTNYQ
jgi:hypothetical protein